MLQYIGQYRNIVAIHRIEFFDQAGAYVEACFARHCSGGLVKFEPFHFEAIALVEPQSTSLITADIQKPARAAPLVKGHISIEPYPHAVEERKEKSFPPARVTCVCFSPKVIVSLVELLELGYGRGGKCLFQTAMNTSMDFIRPRAAKPRIRYASLTHFQCPSTKEATTPLRSLGSSRSGKYVHPTRRRLDTTSQLMHRFSLVGSLSWKQVAIGCLAPCHRPS